MLQCDWDATLISFGEMKARQIFSFAFHVVRLIDALL